MQEFIASTMLGFWILLKVAVLIGLICLGIYLIYWVVIVTSGCNPWILGGIAGFVLLCLAVGSHVRWHSESMYGPYSMRKDKMVALGHTCNCWNNAPQWYKSVFDIK